ncbi:MAG TPA: ABC transporter permease, partial [Gemmatimonadales bacterium]|nr:ABC transporter permease [Gemmatimonadales bacterium]
MDGFIQDLRLSFRSITRTPGMSLAAILTLALGIGANTAIFGVIDALFLRPPAHVVAPEQVHRLGSTAGSIRSWARYLDFKAHAHTVRVAAYFGPRPLSLGQGAEAKEIQSMLVTADFFPLLGVAPRLGRFFTEEEAAPGGAQVAVVSEEYWRNELGASSDALGRPLQVGRQSYTIIGVAPARFSGVDLTRPDLWLPMGVAAPVALWADVLNCGRCSWLNLVARRQAGITPAAATSELTSLFRATVIQAGDSTASVTLGPLMQPVGTDAARGARVSTWLGVACVVVLLVACVNVANLLLTRASRRRREIAVRVALGSRRMQLIRQLYLESGLLALAGGAAALLTSLWAGPALMRLLLPTSPAEPVRIRVLLFTSAVALVTTVLAGLAPVLHATTPDLATALKSGTREGGGRRSLTQTGLLVAQVALTLTLLTGASLFLRSLDRVHAQRLGFEP